MNVQDNLLMQMYQSMENLKLPEVGASSPKEDKSSFQELMTQARNEALQPTQETKESSKPVEQETDSKATSDAVEKPSVEGTGDSKSAQDSEDFDSMLTNYMDVAAFFFRPEIQMIPENRIVGEMDQEAAVDRVEIAANLAAAQVSEQPELQVLQNVQDVRNMQNVQNAHNVEHVQDVPQMVQTAQTMELAQPAAEKNPSIIEVPEQTPNAQQTTAPEMPVSAEPMTTATETTVPEVEWNVMGKADAAQQEQVLSDAAPDEDTAEFSEEMPYTQQPLFRDMQEAPVKVGENYRLDTTQPDMEQKLANTIHQAAKLGEQKIEIRLNPEHLGTIVVEMTKTNDGALQVVLHAANVKTTAILSQNLNSLNQTLQNLNHNQVQVEVQQKEENASSQQHPFQQADPDGHGQQQQQQHQRRQEKTSPEDFLQQLRLGLFSLDDVE